jgi:hypothetical protein
MTKYLELLDLDVRKDLDECVLNAVGESFQEDQSTPTNDEARRRAALCYEAFKIMRFDLRWSIPRIKDSMPRLLREALDGDLVQMLNQESGRSLWVPPEQA